MRKVYFDLDGVLANFELAIVRTLEKPYLDREDNSYWEKLDQIPHLYLNLDPLYGGRQMVETVIDRIGIENVEILTALPKPTGYLNTAREDKEKWVHRHINKNLIVNTIEGGKNKYIFLKDNPGSILIDDYERNLRIWQEHGGQPVLHIDPVSTLAKLEYIPGLFE